MSPTKYATITRDALPKGIMLKRVLIALICVTSCMANAQKAPVTLAERFTKIRQAIDRAPPPLLYGKHVVFVAGIMNELADLISNYFPDNIEAVQNMGATTSYLAPSSSLSIPQNAQILYREIRSIYDGVRSPLVLVGHSKGGAEVLHLILEHPELVLDGIVDTVLLIQPAIGGSPLAYKSGPWISLVSAFLSPNLETLTPHKAKENFDLAFAKYDSALAKLVSARQLRATQEAISKRIFYIRATQDPAQLGWGVGLVLRVWRSTLSYDTPNDGLLPLTSQIDPRIGTDLGVLRADHIDLVVSEVTNMSAFDRKAVTYAAFEQIAAVRALVRL